MKRAAGTLRLHATQGRSGSFGIHGSTLPGPDLKKVDVTQLLWKSLQERRPGNLSFKQAVVLTPQPETFDVVRVPPYDAGWSNPLQENGAMTASVSVDSIQGRMIFDLETPDCPSDSSKKVEQTDSGYVLSLAVKYIPPVASGILSVATSPICEIDNWWVNSTDAWAYVTLTIGIMVNAYPTSGPSYTVLRTNASVLSEGRINGKGRGEFALQTGSISESFLANGDTAYFVWVYCQPALFASGWSTVPASSTTYANNGGVVTITESDGFNWCGSACGITGNVWVPYIRLDFVG